MRHSMAGIRQALVAAARALQTRRHSDARSYPGASVVLRAEALSTQEGEYEIRSDVCVMDREGVPIPGTFRGQVTSIGPLPARRSYLESGFIFFANPWTENFQHFFVELFPKLVDYLAVRAVRPEPVPLLVR